MTEKSLPQPSSPQVRSRMLAPYVVGWSALAIISLVYLGLLATQPTLVAGYLGATDEVADTAPDAAETAANTAIAEVRTLRSTIDLFRNELIELRAHVSSQTDASRDLANRIAAIEAVPADPQRTANLTAKEKAALAKAAKAKGAEPASKATAAADPKAARGAPDAPSLETGSVASPEAGAITFGPPTVTTTIAVPPKVDNGNNQVGVQIATGPSVDSLRLSWTLLNERHGDAIRALEPRYKTDVSGNEQTFDLVVGPVANVDEARKLCQELALKATPCQVARFTGDAL